MGICDNIQIWRVDGTGRQRWLRTSGLRVRVPYPSPEMRPLSVGSAFGLQNQIMQVRVLSDAPLELLFGGNVE